MLDLGEKAFDCAAKLCWLVRTAILTMFLDIFYKLGVCYNYSFLSTANGVKPPLTISHITLLVGLSEGTAEGSVYCLEMPDSYVGLSKKLAGFIETFTGDSMAL